MMRSGLCVVVAGLVVAGAGCGRAQTGVPTAPSANAKVRHFVDARYGVRFDVPAGWSVTRRDGEVSTFRNDARTAPRTSLVRGVASIDFNPLPHSTLAGALFYYSVQPHESDKACAAQAKGSTGKTEVVPAAGASFAHGHDEHGGICVESRDEVYTAYRRNACYRFDMVVNTFCSAASGAQELTAGQLHDINAQMSGMLSTLVLSWEKSGAEAVPVPVAAGDPHRPIDAVPTGGSGTGR